MCRGVGAARVLIGCLLVGAQQRLCADAQTPQQLSSSRSVDEVGDPTSEALCGQKRTKSLVCDPDDILSEEHGTAFYAFPLNGVDWLQAVLGC